ncbi:hypothetical protein [Legionella longbeachae]|uniref:hypothetical protein n=1 Tax=Legionella longbeachae TaxID=450 RepID=UPI001248710C|nr:hypothetical protein [Legionella longbeachae]QEY50493.1 hypothetical protein FQU71_04100 [Legionella longbeachae]
MDSSVFASNELVKREVFAYVYPTINERVISSIQGLDDIRTLYPSPVVGHLIHSRREVFSE